MSFVGGDPAKIESGAARLRREADGLARAADELRVVAAALQPAVGSEVLAVALARWSAASRGAIRLSGIRAEAAADCAGAGAADLRHALGEW